ncbi:hypothetical protein [Streptomyces acidiscabies]|uniref:hypothetical protein n=1 Tax=Streptomyces acidiscabies TaxID=42234 RepID=UPI00117E82AF|nr:hypothetical protein [Streptomyces acidiscabies]
MADPTPSSAVETMLAQRLAHNHGWLDDDESWDRAGVSFRKDYLELARETLAVVGGPTETQRQLAVLAIEARELKRQRNRYRKAWLNARRRALRSPQ